MRAEGFEPPLSGVCHKVFRTPALPLSYARMKGVINGTRTRIGLKRPYRGHIPVAFHSL